MPLDSLLLSATSLPAPMRASDRLPAHCGWALSVLRGGPFLHFVSSFDRLLGLLAVPVAMIVTALSALSRSADLLAPPLYQLRMSMVVSVFVALPLGDLPSLCGYTSRLQLRSVLTSVGSVLPRATPVRRSLSRAAVSTLCTLVSCAHASFIFVVVPSCVRLFTPLPCNLCPPVPPSTHVFRLLLCDLVLRCRSVRFFLSPRVHPCWREPGGAWRRWTTCPLSHLFHVPIAALTARPPHFLPSLATLPS